MPSLNGRLVKLEAAAPPLPNEPSGEQREEEAIWLLLTNQILATMPAPTANRVVGELESGMYSRLAARLIQMVERAVPEPWTCALAGCECSTAGRYEPLALPEAVCTALDDWRGNYEGGSRQTCSTCAYELPRPWADPCPVCGAPYDGRGYLSSPAREAWLEARAAALGRYQRREPLTDQDRYVLDRRGHLATLAGARAPGAPAPAPVAEGYGGAHTQRFDIRHEEVVLEPA